MARCRIVIQARTSSSRLPAKAFLPVAGLPSVVLCALRAANHGADVVVATSDEPSDDLLVEELGRHGIKVVRGEINDVLGRFLVAVADMHDQDVVLRLTADNVFPDGDFVSALLQHFESVSEDYVATHSPFDGLPYGLSAELFTVAVLRQAARTAVDAFDREHVTPWIRRNAQCARLDYSHLGLGRRLDQLRCTIDTLADYERVARLFDARRAQAIQIGWRDLVMALEASPDAPRFRIPFKSMENGQVCGSVTLGTVQFGIPYGIANNDGLPSDEQVAAIFRCAVEHGVTDLDTARAYGMAESRIGRIGGVDLSSRARILTKLDPLAWLAEDATPEMVRSAVDASVFASCRNLRVNRLDMLMLHRWAHRKAYSGHIWARLLELREDGVVGALGVSLSTPIEAVDALAEPDIVHIQLPCNLLDWRWEASSGFIERRHMRTDVTIHARSAFLQGLLLCSAQVWPPAIADAGQITSQLDSLAKELGRTDKADLCLAYLAGLDWIDSIVIGVDNVSHLRTNLDRMRNAPLSSIERARVNKTIGRVPERLLNPALWFK